MRTAYRTIGLYLILRVAGKALLKDRVLEFFGALFRKYIFSDASDKLIGDTARLVEVNALVGVNILLLRKCFYSFILEFLAD